MTPLRACPALPYPTLAARGQDKRTPTYPTHKPDPLTTDPHPGKEPEPSAAPPFLLRNPAALLAIMPHVFILSADGCWRWSPPGRRRVEVSPGASQAELLEAALRITRLRGEWQLSLDGCSFFDIRCQERSSRE